MAETAEPRLHLILTQDDPYVPFITTPQAPGVVLAERDPETLLARLDDHLAELGAADQPYVIHTQFVDEADGVTFNLRFANDEHVLERIEVVERIWSSFDIEGQAWFNGLHRDASGSFTIVAARREDLVEDLVNEFGPLEAPVFVVLRPDGSLRARQFVGDRIRVETDDEHSLLPSIQGIPVSEMEAPEGVTLGELIDSAPTIGIHGGITDMPETTLAIDMTEPTRMRQIGDTYVLA